jgi:hypothetical protein
MVWVGSLAACHSGGDAAPDGKTPTTAAPAAAEAPAATSPTEGSATEGASAAEPTTPAPPATDPAAAATAAAPATGPDGECESRKAAIESALGEANRCASDAECTLMYPNCPFGCARPVSTTANLDAIRANIDAFKAACNACVYRCMPPKGAPTCKAGRCSFGEG